MSGIVVLARLPQFGVTKINRTFGARRKWRIHTACCHTHWIEAWSSDVRQNVPPGVTVPGSDSRLKQSLSVRTAGSAAGVPPRPVIDSGVRLALKNT